MASSKQPATSLSLTQVHIEGLVLAVEPVKTKNGNSDLARVLIGTYAPKNKAISKEQMFKVSVWDYTRTAQGSLEIDKWFVGNGFLKYKSFTSRGKRTSCQEIEFFSRMVTIRDVPEAARAEAEILKRWYVSEGQPRPNKVQDDGVGS